MKQKILVRHLPPERKSWQEQSRTCYCGYDES